MPYVSPNHSVSALKVELFLQLTKAILCYAVSKHDKALITQLLRAVTNNCTSSTNNPSRRCLRSATVRSDLVLPETIINQSIFV